MAFPASPPYFTLNYINDREILALHVLFRVKHIFLVLLRAPFGSGRKYIDTNDHLHYKSSNQKLTSLSLFGIVAIESRVNSKENI